MRRWEGMLVGRDYTDKNIGAGPASQRRKVTPTTLPSEGCKTTDSPVSKLGILL